MVLYQTITEYEINTPLIESLNSVEKRAAIETGQEVDRSDINMRMGLADQAAILRKAFTLEELEAMDARIEAARNGETKQLPHPTATNSFSNKDPPTPHHQRRRDFLDLAPVAQVVTGDSLDNDLERGSGACLVVPGELIRGSTSEPGRKPRVGRSRRSAY